ncbi:uncharacterized protein LOC103520999, partial [Diaphorina citri]|uniref:Uncharacterized protein LOC103520999 n=1 Tax=Diaphorina citri TaxID=121845 RepID=A0A1S4EPQ8_DIACI
KLRFSKSSLGSTTSAVNKKFQLSAFDKDSNAVTTFLITPIDLPLVFQCVAFDDINPQAPEHFLVLPKKKIVSLSLAADEDAKILGHLMIVAKKVAAKKLIRNYRVVVNNGWEAVQFSGHLHLHVLGGRPLHWPPG